MATLSQTYGITLVVSTSSTEYGGPSSNEFFGGSSDRIAMIRLNAPDALGENEVLTAANFISYFKADTTADSDTITIGLIDGAWTTTTTNYSTLYGYIEATTVSVALTTSTTATQKTLAVTSLLQTWAANPSAYSGLYFRKSSLSLTRISTGSTISTTLTTRTACSAPTSVSLAKTTADPGEAVNLSWSGAAAGTLNSIAGYIIQRSTNGGAYDEDWATDTASPLSVTAHATWGSTYTYRIVTHGQYIDSAPSTATVTLTTRTPTACGAPTSATVSPSLAESSPTLSYSGAAPGTLNAISAYEIEYADSTNNSTWGSWTALDVVSNTGTSGSVAVAVPSTRGNYRVYRIRTRGAAGATYYSAWKQTESVRRNQLPTVPTAFTATPEVFSSGMIALNYSGATDPDSNLSTHNVQYAVSTDGGLNWGAWVSLSNGAVSHTPTLNPGDRIKYQVRSVDALGAVSSSWVESNSCGQNTAPSAPTVSLPQNSKTTHSSQPRFLLTLGADPESQLQAITASRYTASRSSGLSSGAKIVLRKSAAAAPGTVSLSATSADPYAETSTAATRDTTYAAPSYTDATVAKGTTPIKAAHVTELRTMVNTVRAYYGLSAVSWAETITAGVTKARNWQAHIVELRAAIDDIVTLVNGWDTTTTVNNIPAPAWITLTAQPSAAVMEQIRRTIEVL